MLATDDNDGSSMLDAFSGEQRAQPNRSTEDPSALEGDSDPSAVAIPVTDEALDDLQGDGGEPARDASPYHLTPETSDEEVDQHVLPDSANINKQADITETRIYRRRGRYSRVAPLTIPRRTPLESLSATARDVREVSDDRQSTASGGRPSETEDNELELALKLSQLPADVSDQKLDELYGQGGLRLWTGGSLTSSPIGIAVPEVEVRTLHYIYFSGDH